MDKVFSKKELLFILEAISIYDGEIYAFPAERDSVITKIDELMKDNYNYPINSYKNPYGHVEFRDDYYGLSEEEIEIKLEEQRAKELRQNIPRNRLTTIGAFELRCKREFDKFCRDNFYYRFKNDTPSLCYVEEIVTKAIERCLNGYINCRDIIEVKVTEKIGKLVLDIFKEDIDLDEVRSRFIPQGILDSLKITI